MSGYNTLCTSPSLSLPSSLSLAYFLTPPSPTSPRAHTFCLLFCHTSSVLFQFSIFSFLMYYSSKRLTTSSPSTSLSYQQSVIFLGDFPEPVSLLGMVYNTVRSFVTYEENKDVKTDFIRLSACNVVIFVLVVPCWLPCIDE